MCIVVEGVPKGAGWLAAKKCYKAQWMHGAQGKDDGTCITTKVSHTNKKLVYKIQFINTQWVLVFWLLTFLYVATIDHPPSQSALFL